MEASSSSSSRTLSVSSEHLKTDALQHPPFHVVCGSDQHLHADCDSPLSLQDTTSPSSTPRHADRSVSPVGSDKGSESGNALTHTQTDSALFTQLELLHQECQEKEALINKLGEQLADWEELHAQHQTKEQQYVEALQAAESTIAYLTACSLDGQPGFGAQANVGTGSSSVGSDSVLRSRCMELQNALQEKEDLNKELIELLNMAEQAISSSDSQAKNPEIGDLCLKIEEALQQVKPSSNRDSPRADFKITVESVQELQQHVDSLQDALLKENRLNAELQEKLRAADAAAQQGHSSDIGSGDGECSKQNTGEHHAANRGSDNSSLSQEMTNVLVNCLSAVQSTVASLSAHCSNIGSSPSARSSKMSPDLQMNLDKLKRALQERQELRRHTHSTTISSINQTTASDGTKGQLHQELHQNLCLLYKIFSNLSQRISELQASLQEERVHREDVEAHRILQDGKALPLGVQVQPETLHKALREKKKACKSREEKLAAVLTKTPSPESALKGEITSSALFQMVSLLSRLSRNTGKERGNIMHM